MPDPGRAQDSQQVRLAAMFLSAVVWSLFGYDVLIFLGSEVASAHEALAPSAASFWSPWWDMAHPASGIHMAVLLAIGTSALLLHVRWAGVAGAAVPVGRLGLTVLGFVAAAVLVDRFAWDAIALITTASGAGEALLQEREDFAYTLTEAHLPGEFLWSVVAAPVFEEMCFRGLLLGCLLARGWNPWVSITLTAAAFAAIHGQYYAPGLISVFIAGVLLGWLRLSSGGLIAPVLAHAAMNLWVFAEDWQSLAIA